MGGSIHEPSVDRLLVVLYLTRKGGSTTSPLLNNEKRILAREYILRDDLDQGSVSELVLGLINEVTTDSDGQTKSCRA